jgi:hypothetical protein
MPSVPEPRACSLKLSSFCPIEPAIHPDVTLVEARAITGSSPKNTSVISKTASGLSAAEVPSSMLV